MAQVVTLGRGPFSGRYEAPPKFRVEMPRVDEEGGTLTVNQVYKVSAENQIGEGKYGQVFMGYDRRTNDKVALKKVRLETEKEGLPRTAIREIKILTTLQHDNIIRLREIVRSEPHPNNYYRGSVYLAFDFAEYDLAGLIETQRCRFTEPQVKCLIQQLLAGLAHCHRHGVLHRDLKPQNVLVDARGTVKLADFGLGRVLRGGEAGGLTNDVITRWYKPPELLLGAEQYGPEVDVWSAGCIFAELLIGRPLFPGNEEMDQLDRIFAALGTPSEESWPGVARLPWFANVPPGRHKGDRLQREVARARAESGLQLPVPGDLPVAGAGTAFRLSAGALSFLRRMLVLNPRERVTADEALADPYLTSEEPVPCPRHLLPTSSSCHEFTRKRWRDGQRAQLQAAPVNAPTAAAAAAATVQREQGGGGKRYRYDSAVPLPYQAPPPLVGAPPPPMPPGAPPAPPSRPYFPYTSIPVAAPPPAPVAAPMPPPGYPMKPLPPVGPAATATGAPPAPPTTYPPLPRASPRPSHPLHAAAPSSATSMATVPVPGGVRPPPPAPYGAPIPPPMGAVPYLPTERFGYQGVLVSSRVGPAPPMAPPPGAGAVPPVTATMGKYPFPYPPPGPPDPGCAGPA